MTKDESQPIGMRSELHAKALSSEVLVALDPIVQVGRKEIELLKTTAARNERLRVRLCAHPNTEDRLHEMLIVHARGAYVRPHKHFNKIESFHIIEGLVDVIIFGDDGVIIQIVKMGDYVSGRTFYYRLSVPCYHSLLVRTEQLVFHEITNGPFNRADMLFAPWAPDETDQKGAQAFMRTMEIRLREIESDG